MLSKLKKMWSARVEDTPAVRTPKSDGPALADNDPALIIAPTRFASPAAREFFCAAVLQAQHPKREP
jgi:hypothetical protein